MTKKAHEERRKKASVKQQKGNHVHNFLKVVCVCVNKLFLNTKLKSKIEKRSNKLPPPPNPRTNKRLYFSDTSWSRGFLRNSTCILSQLWNSGDVLRFSASDDGTKGRRLFGGGNDYNGERLPRGGDGREGPVAPAEPPHPQLRRGGVRYSPGNHHRGGYKSRGGHRKWASSIYPILGSLL